MVKKKGVEQGEINRDGSSLVDRCCCNLEHRGKKGKGDVLNVWGW